MVIAPRSDEMSCLIRNLHITIDKALIHQILELEMCDIHIFLHKADPTLEGYNPSDAYYRVAGKDFENATKISTNQLTLPCKLPMLFSLGRGIGTK